MIRWTGLVPWEFEFPFPGSLTSTFLSQGIMTLERVSPPAGGDATMGVDQVQPKSLWSSYTGSYPQKSYNSFAQGNDGFGPQ